MTIYDEAGHQGLRDEVQLINWLRRSFPWCHISSSSPTQNIQDDIDLFWCNNSYSIKCMPTASRYGNVVLEDSVQWRHSGQWGKSWLWNTRADFFLFLLDNKILLSTPVTILQEHVKAHPQQLVRRTKKVHDENSRHGHSDVQLYKLRTSVLETLSLTITKEYSNETLHPLRSSCINCLDRCSS